MVQTDFYATAIGTRHWKTKARAARRVRDDSYCRPPSGHSAAGIHDDRREDLVCSTTGVELGCGLRNTMTGW